MGNDGRTWPNDGRTWLGRVCRVAVSYFDGINTSRNFISEISKFCRRRGNSKKANRKILFRFCLCYMLSYYNVCN